MLPLECPAACRLLTNAFAVGNTGVEGRLKVGSLVRVSVRGIMSVEVLAKMEVQGCVCGHFPLGLSHFTFKRGKTSKHNSSLFFCGYVLLFSSVRE